MRSWGHVVLAAAVAVCSSVAWPAEAAPKAEARKLFYDGVKLMKSGDTEAACNKLAESLALEAAPGTRFKLAECDEQRGRMASAHRGFTRVADEAAKAGKPAHEKAARDRADGLASKLCHIELALPADAEVREVALDGESVPETAWKDLIVDPGTHELTATVAGEPWSKTVDVEGEGARVTVTIPQPTRDETEPQPLAKPVEPEPPDALPADEGGMSGQAIAGLIVGAAGVVALGVGAGFGGASMAQGSEADEHCDEQNRCDPEGLTLRDDAITSGTISTIGLAAGGGLLALGVVLFLTAPSDDVDGETTTAWAAAPWASPDLLGVSISRSW